MGPLRILPYGTEPPPDGGRWWVRVERQWHADAMVGPYVKQRDAEHALEREPLVDSLVYEDALDCYVTSAAPRPGDDVVVPQ